MLLLGSNVLYGAEPEGHLTVTTIYLDYLLEQVFWQHSHILRDRLDTPRFAKAIYAEGAKVLCIGEELLGLWLPALDEPVALSVDGELRRFHRIQSLWFALGDQISPLIRVIPVRQSASQRAHIQPTHPRARRFTPTRQTSLPDEDPTDPVEDVFVADRDQVVRPGFMEGRKLEKQPLTCPSNAPQSSNNAV